MVKYSRFKSNGASLVCTELHFRPWTCMTNAFVHLAHSNKSKFINYLFKFVLKFIEMYSMQRIISWRGKALNSTNQARSRGDKFKKARATPNEAARALMPALLHRSTKGFHFISSSHLCCASKIGVWRRAWRIPSNWYVMWTYRMLIYNVRLNNETA